MAPNRKQVTLLCESIDIQDLRVVVHPSKVALQHQQQLQQRQQRERAVTNSDSYWEWTSPEGEFEPEPEEPKVVDFFSVDRIVSNLVSASAKNEPAKTLPSSDDYWSERDYASSGAEKSFSVPLHQQERSGDYTAEYWQWSQEPSESDNYWRPEQPSCAAAAASPADDDDMMKYYWNEAPTTIRDEELVQGYWDWSSAAEPATESDSYWHWNNGSATAAEAASRRLILSA